MSINNNLDWRETLYQFKSKLEPATLLQAPWVAHVPFWLNVLFIVLLAKAAADLTWTIFSPASNSFSTTVSNTIQSSIATSKPRLAKVSRLHLFGMAKGKVVPVTENIKKTRLQLSLRGVFASTDPNQAMAIISDGSKGKGHAYKVGDRLPQGAVLHEVRATEVIINRNGRLESLPLPVKTLTNLIIKNHGSTRKASVRNIQPSQRLRKLRDSFVNSPGEFMKNARIEPVINPVDGSTKGFTFSHNDPRIMEELGVTRGDVITGLNGLSVSDNPAAVYDQLMKALKNGEPLNLEIERKGVNQSINIQP